MGAHGEGPVTDPNDLTPALARAIDSVNSGQPAVVDVVWQRGGGGRFAVVSNADASTTPPRASELFTANIGPTKIAEVAVLRHDADCGRERGGPTGDIPWAQRLPI
jgi:hypothetical protein